MIALCLPLSPKETDRKKQRVPTIFVFVDNLGVFGVGKASVRDRLCQAIESFDKRGLKTHEVQSGTVTCLGNQLDRVEHRSSSTDVRFWRLLPGRIWEVILGHCTFLGLQERGCLGTLFTIYPFIRKYYFSSERLFGTVHVKSWCVSWV